MQLSVHSVGYVLVNEKNRTPNPLTYTAAYEQQVLETEQQLADLGQASADLGQTSFHLGQASAGTLDLTHQALTVGLQKARGLQEGDRVRINKPGSHTGRAAVISKT